MDIHKNALSNGLTYGWIQLLTVPDTMQNAQAYTHNWPFCIEWWKKNKRNKNQFDLDYFMRNHLVAIIFQLLNGIELVLAWFQPNRMNGSRPILKPLISVVRRFHLFDFEYMVNFQSKTVFWREKLNSIHLMAFLFHIFFPSRWHVAIHQVLEW